MKKRILASFLSLVLVLSLVPVSALAVEEQTGPETPVCAGLEGCTEDVHDPACPLYVAPGGDDNAYYEFEDVTTLGTPSALTTQAADGMSGNCGNPTYVDGDTTPTDKVKWELTQNNIGSGEPTYTLTFTGTGDITWEWRTEDAKRPPYYFYASKITKVVVGEGITGGARAACAGCTNLTEVTLPSTFGNMGNDMFSGCTSLKRIDLPASLYNMGNSVFNGCTALETVNFAPDTGEIKVNGFKGCTSLTSISLPDKVTSVGSFENSGLTSITIDPSVNCVIAGHAFASCNSLESVIIGENVTSIGKQAFYDNAALTTVSISAKEIGEQVFGKCTALANVTLNEGVTIIENNAFATSKDQDKGDLKVLRLPSTITSIGTGLNQAYMLETLDMSAATNIEFPSSSFSLGMDGIVYVSTSEIANALRNADSRDAVAIAVTNGGIFAESQSFTTGTFAAPVQDGKVFAGWYANESFTGESVTSPQTDNQGSATHYPIYYAKWIELKHDAITLEYGSTSTDFPTIEGVSLTGWTSADPAIVEIKDGKMVATGVGTTTITADAAPATRSGETLTVSVTVTAKKIKVSMTDKTETYNEQPHTIEAEAAEGGTLPTDLELVYSYKESNASDDEYIHVAPSHPGTYTVKVESGNPNYTLDGTTTATLTISEPQQEQDVSDHVTVTAPSLVYDGKAKVYTAAYEGITDWTIAYYDTEGTKLDSAPVNARDYWVTINGDGAGVYASITESFTITPATLTIKANNQSIRVGDQLPEYTYTVSGWQGNDTDDLLSGVTATCPTADANKAGDYTITVSGPAAIDNYTISYVDGTLTVSRRSSGGSGGGSSSSSTTTETERNPDGSTTTTVTDKKTGTVTETTKFKDGSTLVVETKKDGTVTTTETAKNGVKVKTVDEPGEDVTATVTIPRSVGEAVVTIPADVDYGMVAADADTGEIVKLSVPTEDGMTVKLDGSAELVLVDRSLDFTDTNGHWAEDAIDFATAHELFAGTSDTTFTPDSPMTRAMLMTVLARFDGQDTTGGAVWYEKAMDWAKENGISDGSNPNSSITREQLATMLWRYAGSPTGDGSLSSFGDSASVNGYAVEAMRWAVGEGLISGTDAGLLAPQGNATRAQVATILMRFVESLTK